MRLHAWHANNEAGRGDSMVHLCAKISCSKMQLAVQVLKRRGRMGKSLFNFTLLSTFSNFGASGCRLIPAEVRIDSIRRRKSCVMQNT